jgi:hypothetical protein
MHRDGTPSGGRPKGRVNEKTLQVQRMCRQLVADPLYQERLRERLIAGTLGQMEVVIWHYAFGRPKESLDVRLEVAGEDLAKLSLDELIDMAKQLEQQLEDAKYLEASIPAEYWIHAPKSPCEEVE